MFFFTPYKWSYFILLFTGRGPPCSVGGSEIRRFVAADWPWYVENPSLFAVFQFAPKAWKRWWTNAGISKNQEYVLRNDILDGWLEHNHIDNICIKSRIDPLVECASKWSTWPTDVAFFCWKIGDATKMLNDRCGKNSKLVAWQHHISSNPGYSSALHWYRWVSNIQVSIRIYFDIIH